ncbi:hypothetical protein CRG98_029605, partial [Punica granatum]
ARFEGPFACQWSEPRELCQKRRPWGVGVSRLKQGAPEMRPDVSSVTLALRGIFETPYWAPFGVSVARGSCSSPAAHDPVSAYLPLIVGSRIVSRASVGDSRVGSRWAKMGC